VIERAARRRDDDVSPALERADLQIHRRPAVEGDDTKPDALGVFVDRFGHLHGKLTRRYEDQALDVLVRFAGLRDALQHRERERGCFPGAGRRLCENVAPAQEHGDGLALHGCRFLVTEGGHGCDERLGQTEGAEIAGGVGGHARKHRSMHLAGTGMISSQGCPTKRSQRP
jgi:hypothetical protein